MRTVVAVETTRTETAVTPALTIFDQAKSVCVTGPRPEVRVVATVAVAETTF